jgi:hypothetical protein
MFQQRLNITVDDILPFLQFQLALGHEKLLHVTALDSSKFPWFASSQISEGAELALLAFDFEHFATLFKPAHDIFDLGILNFERFLYVEDLKKTYLGVPCM